MTAPSDLVRVTIDGAIATIELARDAKRNALNVEFANDIADAFARIDSADCDLVVLRSAGPVFCAGVDLTEPMRLDSESPELVVVQAILNSNAFLVTVIDGPALAGGLIFAALSPVVIASERAIFWLPERSIGLFPGRVLAFLEEVMPPRQAFWYGLTERQIDAKQAQALGLVSEVIAPEILDIRVADLVSELASSAPGFLQAARASWALHFTSPSQLSRRADLDALLARNVHDHQRF